MRWFGLTMLCIGAIFAGGACGSDPEQKDKSEQSLKVEEAAKERESKALTTTLPQTASSIGQRQIWERWVWNSW